MEENMIFIYHGAEYTPATFASEYNLSAEDAEAIIEELMERGLARIKDEESVFDKFMRENSDKFKVKQEAENIRNSEYETILRNRENNTKGVPKYTRGVNFAFDSKYEATAFANSAISMGIPAADMSISFDGKTVSIKNLTETEFNRLALEYKTKKATAKATEFVSKGAKTLTNVAAYTGENVVVPVAKTTFRAAGDIIKTLAKTGVKAGSALISATNRAICETKEEIANDPDAIVGADDINNMKEAVKNKLGGGLSAGITFG